MGVTVAGAVKVLAAGCKGKTPVLVSHHISSMGLVAWPKFHPYSPGHYISYGPLSINVSSLPFLKRLLFHLMFHRYYYHRKFAAYTTLYL